jgi:hypothetical protein
MRGLRWRLRWRELGNKLEAFETFRRGELQARAGGSGLALAALVERALPLAPCRTLWTLEGLGYGHAEVRAAAGAEPRGLLAAAGGLPAACLIALHCGIGLSLARRRLAASARVPAAKLRRGLAGYLDACRELARPGCAAPLLEALGFIARLRLARRAGEVARELAQLDEEAHACFWHGWGRALYFLPSHALPRPDATRRLLAALRMAPAGVCRGNALAGLAWALTLVNLRHPQLLEEFLRGRAAEVGEEPGFAHGVSSAVLVWHSCVPDDPYLASWRRHRPDPIGGELVQLWGRQVSGPAEAALDSDPDGLRCTGNLDGLFRFWSSPRPSAVQAKC